MTAERALRVIAEWPITKTGQFDAMDAVNMRNVAQEALQAVAMTDTTQSNFTPADMATAAAQGFRDGESAERTRCAQAVRTTLANWRCIPSAHLREFAELVIAEIEKPAQQG